MAMELEFYLPDGPNGEAMDFAIRVAAHQILSKVTRYRRPEHCYIILRHTTRQKGEWIIWVKPGYTSGTAPMEGALHTIK